MKRILFLEMRKDKRVIACGDSYCAGIGALHALYPLPLFVAIVNLHKLDPPTPSPAAVLREGPTALFDIFLATIELFGKCFHSTQPGNSSDRKASRSSQRPDFVK